MPLPVHAIAANSKRLYDEAHQAFGEGRLATATALAIFSIEESAKHAILKRQAKRPNLPPKRITRHEIKHQEIGELFWYWAIYSVLSKTFQDFHSFASTLPDADKETLDFISRLSGGEAVDFLRYNMFKSEEEMRTYVHQNFPHPELLDISALGKSGAVEALRKRCLYVDLSSDGSGILSTPESVSQSDAIEWLKIAWFGQEYIALANRVWGET